MSDFGIEVINNDYREFVIKGNQRYNARNYRVEGDYSQAAFFLCADALGNNVLCKDLDLKSLQGDKEVIDIMTKDFLEDMKNSEELKLEEFNNRSMIKKVKESIARLFSPIL